MADSLTDSPIYQQMLNYLMGRGAVPKQSKEFANDVRPSKKDILSLIEEQFAMQFAESKGVVDQFTDAYKKLRPAQSPAITLVGTSTPAVSATSASGGATAATETMILLDLANRAQRR
jgi:hypothetical protein